MLLLLIIIIVMHGNSNITYYQQLTFKLKYQFSVGIIVVILVIGIDHTAEEADNSFCIYVQIV